MAFESIEDIRARTEELRQRVAAARIAEGKPPEPPENFVPIPLGIILAEELAPFYKIAVQYAAVIAAGSLVRVDTSRLEKYRETAKLASMSVGVNVGLIGSSVKRALHTMDKINEAIEEGREDEIDTRREMRMLNHFVRNINRSPWKDGINHKSEEPPYVQEAAIKAEVERLKNDPEAYQALLDAAWRRYREIEHLI
ncbi:hypothetical protein KDJ56_14620 [Brevibacillus composti]|uniref:Uncharacterized protein n=2 Tax=Brevibacillus composti TaxID=2796470 RepID=A0A7T5JMI4_9BACL|nr:hypothetical protein [Brevibacillus composti]QQE73154.1 hypothetical protein JD108_14675 [Brevibacillus composti]QUO40232.1 hypothetical protein KDJ56_14620 [Brevibacillus composti]